LDLELRAALPARPAARDLLVITSGDPSIALARLDNFRLGVVELSPKHLELAAIRTGDFDPGFLAVDENPFRIRAAAHANDVALASLAIKDAWVFHALDIARA
jgi:hypothetical protein